MHLWLVVLGLLTVCITVLSDQQLFVQLHTVAFSSDNPSSLFSLCQTGLILMHLWLVVLGLLTVCMSVACLKYCATNRDARYTHRHTDAG
jgi:hypothetical protein